MATMNISLPQQMKDWVEAQTADGAYSNTSDVVRDLIRREQVRREKFAALQLKLDEGETSDYVEIDTRRYFDDLRQD